MKDEIKDTDKLMRVGELAKAVGKTVRAMHLYEELGLLEPRARSEGGFRLYGPEAVDRIHWIVKLQAIGFTLAEIQGFVRDFQDAGSGREATERVRALFPEKQRADPRADHAAPGDRERPRRGARATSTRARPARPSTRRPSAASATTRVITRARRHRCSRGCRRRSLTPRRRQGLRRPGHRSLSRRKQLDVAATVADRGHGPEA